MGRAGVLSGLAVCAAGATVCSPIMAHAALIDDFSVGPVTLADQPGGTGASSTQTNLDAAHVAGGGRLLKFSTRTNNDPTATGYATIAIDESGPGLVYSNDPGVTAANLALTYSGSIPASATSPTTTGLVVDLTDGSGGQAALLLDFDSVNFTSGKGLLEYQVKSTTNGTTVSYGGNYSLANSAGFVTVRLPILNIDATHVTSITLSSANGNLIGDFTLDRIYSAPVPEPASLGIFAAAGALAMRRRNRTP